MLEEQAGSEECGERVVVHILNIAELQNPETW